MIHLSCIFASNSQTEIKRVKYGRKSAMRQGGRPTSMSATDLRGSVTSVIVDKNGPINPADASAFVTSVDGGGESTCRDKGGEVREEKNEVNNPDTEPDEAKAKHSAESA